MRRFRSTTYLQFSYWFAAVAVGIAAVLYAKLIGVVQDFYFQWFGTHPYLVSIATPFIFLGATAFVVKLAPQARGSGIPQVLEAIELSQKSEVNGYGDLVSIRTAVVKVISTTLGILGGASLGREGPTVQISASLFALTGAKMKRLSPKIDFHSYLIAGGAAGVAAAFNTPLAGITFALEEIAHGSSFAKFKEWVMLSVVIAGVTAQGLIGDFLYFGHPTIHAPSLLVIIPEALTIGVVAGLFGGFFARILAYPSLTRWLPKRWWMRALVCGVICSLLILLSQGNSAGSGYEVTRRFMDSQVDGSLPLFFPVTKFLVTVFSYLSGMAGGIFSPCLSIGSGIGFTVGTFLHFVDIKSCTLFGMVAFFAGVVQAPLTAVIIVMEMTDEHKLILPFLGAAYLAQIVARIVMPIPLYSYLAFGTQSNQGPIVSSNGGKDE
ncbi:MAG: chloride channel protein [Bdellovibrionia bacterium]